MLRNRRLLIGAFTALASVTIANAQNWGGNRWDNRDLRDDRRFGAGSGFGNGRGWAEFPRIDVDTEGRGSFQSRDFRSARVNRGYVNTRSQPSVALRANGRTIEFYGDITRVFSGREFQMAITGSSEGRATGSARVRLNGDRNEVEMISVQGAIRGQNFSGSFNR